MGMGYDLWFRGRKKKEREDINANPIVFVFFSMSVETTMARFQ